MYSLFIITSILALAILITIGFIISVHFGILLTATLTYIICILVNSDKIEQSINNKNI